MRRYLRKHIPSMFHRRLTLLGVAVAVLSLVMGAQTIRLATGREHYRRLAEAESVLEVQSLIPTVRGRIVDRKGRVLAEDETGWEVAVQYAVISGEWPREQAKALARRKHRATWVELDAAAQEKLIAAEQPPFDEQVQMLWQQLAGLGATDRLELERRKDAIRQRVQTLRSFLHRHWWEQRRKELGQDVPYHDVQQAIREERVAHTVLPRVPEESRVLIQGYMAEAERPTGGGEAADPYAINPMAIWSQIDLRRPKQRLYPFESVTLVLDRAYLPGPLKSEEPVEATVEGVASHILGGMRDVWQKDIVGENARPFDGVDLGGYLDGDRVGHQGIEGAAETLLRGTRGTMTRHLDTGAVDRLEPVPGRDVELTLDVQLQARVQAIMSPEFGLLQKQDWHTTPPSPEADAAAYGRWRESLGQQLNGAAVVLDVETSEVLAAVTMPAMPRRVLEESPEFIYGDVINLPWVNRTIARPYQPGSTIKPIMLVSAATAGKLDLHDPIFCRGPLDLDKPEQFRCWIFKRYLSQHGPLLGPEAIARSCNVYFYTLGQRMGLQRTIEWYHRFGLGEATDCGLGVAGHGGEEVAGAVGNPRDVYPSDPINMGIGQGPVTWTPMQAAGAYATLARGGLHLSPTLIKDAYRANRRQATDLRLDQHAVADALGGLDEAVNASYGTGHSLGTLREPVFNVEGVRVFGKSGTADPGKYRWIDANRNGKQDKEDQYLQDPGDHAWFIALAQPEGKSRPTHVIAVVVEYAGSGGMISGPVVNQILHAMKLEGYL